MTPSELADAILAGNASISDGHSESDWTAALAELEARCIAKGVAVPDRSDDRFNPEPLVAALKGDAVTSSTPAPEADTAAIVTRLRSERDKATSDLERERAAHASTRGELEKLKASVESNEELRSAKGEVQTLKATIEKLKADHEERIRSLDFDVDQRAAAKIVAIGIREPKAGEHEAYVGRTETLTERCRRAAAAQSKTH